MTPPGGAEGASAEEPEAADTNTDRVPAQPDQVDTEMIDAPTESAKPPSPPAEPVADTPAAAVEISAVEDSKTDATPQKPDESKDAPEPVAKPESEIDETGLKSDATAAQVDNGDKVHESQPSTANGEHPAAAAFKIAKVDDNPGDLISPTVSMSKMGLDGSQDDDVTAPAAKDTNMVDAPSQSSAKVAREREDDDGEPAAKRTKVGGEPAADTPPDSSNEPANEDAMAVDQPNDQPDDTPSQAPAPTPAPAPATAPAAAPSPSPASAPASKPTPTGTPAPLAADGKARYLNDRALDNNPITLHQNREIRKVLGLVKKTKSGQHFRQSVQSLWPTVWEQYRQLIDRPVDISLIEQNLREGKYATMGAFRRDVELLQQNAAKFNGAQHDVTNWAKSTVAQIDERLAAISAEEPQKPAKQEPKQMPTRHAEPRAPPPPPKAKEPRPPAAAPADKSSDNQIYALLPSGLPNIRRDSTKTDGDRPKRPIHPPKNKDLGMAPKSGKNKKKPELRFCEEVLKEVMHQKNWPQNQWFTTPVDPVALNIPTYHSVIKQPMDLGTMNEKLQRGEYESAKDFKSDFNLIIKNCIKFNGEAHPVTDAVKLLEALFEKKWSEKTSWMSKHAQSPARVATSPRANAKEEADTDASEPEQDQGDEYKEALRAVNAVTERLKQEQAELDKKLYSDDPDMSAIETHRTVINFLTNEMVAKRQALNKLQDNKKPAQSKSANKKKSGGGGGGGGANKKSVQAGTGGHKKSAGGSTAKRPAAPKRLTDEEKEIVSEAIGRLDGPLLERAIAIIKKDAKLEVGNQRPRVHDWTISLTLSVFVRPLTTTSSNWTWTNLVIARWSNSTNWSSSSFPSTETISKRASLPPQARPWRQPRNPRRTNPWAKTSRSASCNNCVNSRTRTNALEVAARSHCLRLSIMTTWPVTMATRVTQAPRKRSRFLGQ